MFNSELKGEREHRVLRRCHSQRRQNKSPASNTLAKQKHLLQWRYVKNWLWRYIGRPLNISKALDMWRVQFHKSKYVFGLLASSPQTWIFQKAKANWDHFKQCSENGLPLVCGAVHFYNAFLNAKQRRKDTYFNLIRLNLPLKQNTTFDMN